MSQTATTTPSVPAEAAGASGRKRTRRLWDVAPDSAPVQPIKNPLVENLITGPDGTVTAEFIINDCKHRGLLTRKTVHVQLQTATKTTAVVRGRYLADSKLSSPSDRSLHLFLTSPSMADMTEAIKWIDRVVDTGSTYNNSPTTSETPATPSPPQPSVVKDSDGNLTLTVPVPIPRGAAEGRKFALVGNLLGPDSSYLKHIESQSGCEIQLRNQNRPLAVLLQFEIKGKTSDAVDQAKNLIDDLIQTVKQAFEAAKNAPKPPPPPKSTPVTKPPTPAPAPYAMPPYGYMPPPVPGMMPGMPPVYGMPHAPYPGMQPYYYPGMPPHPGYPAYGHPMAPYTPQMTPQPSQTTLQPPQSSSSQMPPQPSQTASTNENQFPDRPGTKNAAHQVNQEPEPMTKRPRASLPDEDDAEFQKFKQHLTSEPEPIQRPIIPPSSSGINDSDAQRIMKEHLGL